MVRKRILGIGLVISIIFNIFVSNESVACSVENSKVIGDDVVNDDMKVSDSEDVNSMLNALSSGNLSDTITVDSIGNLQSEHNYQNDTDKYWIYTVDCAGELKVKFSDETEVENGSDYIYIYDKYDNQIGKYTGTQLAGKTVSVPYNTIKIRLQSDSSNTSYGFAVDSIVTLDSITVTTLPTITTYLVEESPEYDGIIITGNYSDGSSIVISDGYSFSNIDKTTTGTKTVTVTYSGLTTTFDLNYIEISASSIQVKELPDKTSYSVGEQLDLSGLVLTVTDSKGKLYDVKAGYTYSGYNSDLLGSQNVVISYGGVDTIIIVNVGYAFTYTISSDTVTITGLADNNIKSFFIPESVEGKVVTAIADYAFRDKISVVSISLPDTITSIGERAFYGCTSLESINIPEGITKISDYCFYNCGSLEKIVIPDGVKSIGCEAFYKCSNIKSLTMPCSVIIYDNYAGYSSRGVYNREYSYTSEDGYTMYYHTGSFYGCTGIQEVHITKGTGTMVTYTSRKLKDSSKQGGENYNLLPWIKSSKLEKVIIDEGVTNIGAYSFYDCTNIQNINIPIGVNEIGERAFYGCTSLKSINIPDRITKIPDYCFYNCKNIQKINIPIGVNEIGERAFYGCTSLESINIPEGITKISDYCFYNCGSLEKIVIPDGVKSIGCEAFYKCSNIKRLTMPCSVIIYDNYAGSSSRGVYNREYSYTSEDGYTMYYHTGSFYGCTGIQEVHITKGTGTMVTYSSRKLKDSSKADGENYNLLPWMKNSKLEKVIIDEGVTNIGAYSFYDCNNLKKLYLPDSLSSIETNALSNCSLVVVYASKATVGYNYAKDTGIEVVSTDKIELNKTATTLYRGETATLSATVYMFNGKIDTSSSIQWDSSDEGVVDVNNGKLYVRGPGTATITASYEGEIAQCKVTVYFLLESIHVNKGDISIDVGKTEDIEVYYFPHNTTDDKTISWSTSNESIATVSSDGTVAAVSPGKATITATSIMGPTYTINVCVLMPITTLELEKKSVVLEKGDSTTVGLTVLPLNATDTYKWSSADTNIATVDQTGKITAVGAGNTTITVTTSRGKTVSCDVWTKVSSTSVKINKTNVSLFVDDNLMLETILTPADSTDEIVWSSDNEKVVKVSDDNSLNILAAGTAILKATTSSGAYDTCTVVVGNNINLVDLSLEKYSYSYTSSAICPTVTAKYRLKSLILNKDYRVEYRDNINIGKASVIVTGIGRYSGTKTITFDIIENRLSKDNVKIDLNDEVYTGSAIYKEINIVCNNIILIKGKDYDVVYDNNIVPGTAKVTIKGLGVYSGILCYEFKIKQKQIHSKDIEIDLSAKKYSGEPIFREVNININNVELVQGKDYIVSYKNNINVGTANVVIEGQGNYTGKIEKRFQIAAVSENEITVDAGTNPVYSGNVVKPTITVRWGEKILTDGIDYDIRNTAGFNNISSGSASVDIVLKGNYSGTKIASYTIGMISSGGLTVDLENYSYNYSGNAYLPNVIVKNGNNILRKDSDYTVSYSNNIHAGTATVTVSFIGNYTGIITKNFEINKATINSLFLSSSSFNYSGNEIRPQVIVKDAAGATVGEDNYNVKYINNKNVGTATVIVEGTGDYNGSLTAKYIIVPVLENKNITMYLQQKHKIKVKSSDLVTYKSSRAKIAKVNKKGVVTAKKSGVTIIQIKTGGKNFNVKVKVENPRLSQKRANVFAGDKVVLKVNGGTGKVKWSSSNSKVATVKNGKVTAKKIGKAIINAKKNGKVLSCKIVVKKSAMNRKSVSTIAGEKIKLCVKGISGKPRWSSSNSKVATVSSNGVVSGRSEGNAKITAKYGGIKYTCKVKFKKSSMNKVSDAIMQGKSIQLNIAGISGKPSWSSSNSNIATVSDGIVTGVSVGTATITAKYGGVSYTCNITVEAVKYGSVSGSVTYLYNNFRGNVSDTGATVILISTDGSAKNMPDLTSYVNWTNTSVVNKYNNYGVYATKVDGTGKYVFNNVPVGEYKIVILSENTTDSLAFDNKDAYSNRLVNNVSTYINPANASYLGEIVGFNKYKVETITVNEGRDSYYGYDFGITYL